jgi:hypothetical protein
MAYKVVDKIITLKKKYMSKGPAVNIGTTVGVGNTWTVYILV